MLERNLSPFVDLIWHLSNKSVCYYCPLQFVLKSTELPWSYVWVMSWYFDTLSWGRCQRKLCLKPRPFSWHRNWFSLSLPKCKSLTTFLLRTSSPKRLTFHHATWHSNSCSTYWIIPPWRAPFISHQIICHVANLLIVFSPLFSYDTALWKHEVHISDQERQWVLFYFSAVLLCFLF